MVHISPLVGQEKMAEVRPATILPGQNNSNTPTYFMNHQLTFIDDSYKDPSYGISSADKDGNGNYIYEVDDSNFMLSGYMLIASPTVNEKTFGPNGMDLNGNGTIDEQAVVKAVLFRKKTKNWAMPYVSDY